MFGAVSKSYTARQGKELDMKPVITKHRLFERLKKHLSFGKRHSFNTTDNTVFKEELYIELIFFGLHT